MTPEAPRSAVHPRRRRAGSHAVPSDVAPGVDPAWAEAFLLELRLADVPGRDIGAALAEVASHCAESGESAAEAFGDPAEYARNLDLPAGSDADVPAVGSVIPWVVQALGLMLLADAAHALVDDEPVTLTVGHLVAAALLVVGLAALRRWGAAMLRVVVEHPVVAWLASMAHLALLVASLLLFSGVVARVDGPVVLGIGMVALAAGTLWVLTVLRRGSSEEDPVTAPLAPARSGSAVGAALLRYGPALLVPVVGGALVGTTLLMR